jgi:tetratricopeptide (TPR) repeat protein
LKSAAVIVSAVLFALATTRALGEDTRAAADDAYQIGLWDVAARKYQTLLADGETPQEARIELTLRLAECLIRDGNPSDALILLDPEQQAATHSAAAFWRGQALAGVGRFADAVVEFEAHISIADAPHRLEAALTSAHLQLSLENGSGALRTLAVFAENAPAPEAAHANFQRAAILLDSGFPEDARIALPDEETLPPKQIPAARHTRARLLLAEGEAEEATRLFASLLEDPTGQSIAIHHGAALGLADAIHATTGPEAASRSLLAFLIENPDTPFLDPAFRRLLQWLPENPVAGDPFLEKLAEWIPPPVQPTTGIIPQGDTAAATWPMNTPMDDIAAFAMFTRSVGMHRIDSPAARHEARILMSRLRVVFPGHFLARRSLLIESQWLMDAGKKAAALHHLALAADTSRSATTRGEAVFLEAIARAKDQEEEAAAATLFNEAAALLDAEFAEAARFNAALVRIRETPDTVLDPPDLSANLRATLALERALAQTDPASSLATLESFLRDHPGHPRISEARLASAERAILTTPPDYSFARAQIETLATLESTANIPNAESRIALVRLRLADMTSDQDEAADAVEIARRIIAESPNTPAAVEASLTLGRNLFQTGNYNDARIAFERLALANAEKENADPALTQAAYLLAARAAALGATTQSRDEALSLFDRAIAVENAPLSGIVMLEKARLMIDLNQLKPAIEFLTKARDAMEPGDPLHLPAGILLGEAIYAKGAGDPKFLEQALAIYDDLLARAADDQPGLYHRLQYLRGITLEKLPRTDAPHLKRDAEAIEAYYSVIQRAGDAPPAEWEWFERCAFAALALLEKAERWQASINLARKIAAFNGPRAADAAERASQLQLKHMIWED